MCKRVDYFPDKPITSVTTIFIAHKGGGNFGEANSLEACKYGLELEKGIECDIQRSINNTLWLSHSELLPSCGSFSGKCFPSTSDDEIIKNDSCLGSQLNYTNLEDVFKLMSETYTDKYISLDVKPWQPCDISQFNILRQLNEMAQKIIDLTTKYKLENRVLVESESGDFLYYLKIHTTAVETYLATNGDFEMGVSRALNAGFTGISFKYKFKENITRQHIELIHRKGLKIQLWTVNDSVDIKEAIDLNPDFIQTDNLDYVK